MDAAITLRVGKSAISFVAPRLAGFMKSLHRDA